MAAGSTGAAERKESACVGRGVGLRLTGPRSGAAFYCDHRRSICGSTGFTGRCNPPAPAQRKPAQGSSPRRPSRSAAGRVLAAGLRGPVGCSVADVAGARMGLKTSGGLVLHRRLRKARCPRVPWNRTKDGQGTGRIVLLHPFKAGGRNHVTDPAPCPHRFPGGCRTSGPEHILRFSPGHILRCWEAVPGSWGTNLPQSLHRRGTRHLEPAPCVRTACRTSRRRSGSPRGDCRRPGAGPRPVRARLP